MTVVNPRSDQSSTAGFDDLNGHFCVQRRLKESHSTTGLCARSSQRQPFSGYPKMAALSEVAAATDKCSKPRRGRPRRRENVRIIKLRESTFNLWNQKKSLMGFEAATNSEFAEVLLHRGELSSPKRRRIHEDTTTRCEYYVQ